MKLIQTAIPDVLLIEPTVYEDERGWFMESFNEQLFHTELQKLGQPIPRPFVQDNHSCSGKGVLRGLHYQRAPHAQGKLVRVISGAAFDVAVDIRPGSLTFAKWVGVGLSATNKHMLWIPEGFAHGFVALEEGTEFMYKTTGYYAKECEAAIRWDDPELNVAWPVIEQEISVSLKDRNAQYFSDLKPRTAPVYA
ncbi:dTDP-4-dehydrorhamnose 3,5-epimerase [Stutzerimonas nitrititolerans]|uniref:dTDP-4-dehydrorhamnose 3,5-epimerase n=1 Tax=Stutzerimonas nitrititolerans TaxID=2482751 RepID=UPI00289BD942|nr:dTDP-4-dehydrorhamnose 3,5-epimerase [Stutzerimonas nitrititolerans]